MNRLGIILVDLAAGALALLGQEDGLDIRQDAVLSDGRQKLDHLVVPALTKVRQTLHRLPRRNLKREILVFGEK